ncbi:MAG: hypothetical protein KJ955_06205 [Nanoarchaeota archaeon]|nr:hypothetical protein [Nanoarchaeota archaeon]
MPKKKIIKKAPEPQPKEAVKAEKARPEKRGINKGKAIRILAAIAAVTIIATLLAYYFPKGILEVSSVEGFDKPAGNVEVWIWDRDDFEGRPEKVLKTDENGIARIKLFRGDYAVALQQELLPDNDPPVKYVTFLEIKRGETFQLPLAVRK